MNFMLRFFQSGDLKGTKIRGMYIFTFMAFDSKARWWNNVNTCMGTLQCRQTHSSIFEQLMFASLFSYATGDLKINF